jgi:GT2 family glycosyltransferase
MIMTDGISIALLTYKRPGYLERALASACRQRGDVREILVVDNAADEELHLWLKERFPGVQYLAMNYNGGCDGRNLALRVATAEVVINVDDDVELLGTDCVNRVSEAFADDPRLACLNFQIQDPEHQIRERDWCHPRPIADASRKFETCFILEGHSALRRNAALKVGGYSSKFFLYHEGLDLALRLIDDGFHIVYTPDVAVVHHVAPDVQRAYRFYYCSVRNGIWIAYQYLPFFSAVGDVLEHVAKMTFFAARAGQIGAHLQGCIDAVRGLSAMERRPLHEEALERLKAIRSERPPLFARIQRHLAQQLQ